MNKLRIVLIAMTIGFSLPCQKAFAQWDLFSDLFSQMDSTTFNQYFNNLGNLDSTFNVDHVDGNFLLYDLYDSLDLPAPGGNLDSSFIFGLDSGLDTLINHLPGFGLDSIDADTLLGELDHLQDIFETNFDSLGGLFNQYQDSLKFDSLNWKLTIIGFDSLSALHLDVLQDTLGMVMDTTLPQNPHDFAGLIKKLFDPIAFPDLELAFGIQKSDLKYWGQEYSADAKVFRIGSVPRFDKEDMQCHNMPGLMLPIEPRWHVQASWLTKRIPTYQSDHYFAHEEDRKGFNPLVLQGDFAMMATPGIGRWGNTSFRMITSLGIEFGTYAPKHQDYAPPFTAKNKGYATGFGPQIGAGFTMTTGPLVIYTLATIAKGDVLRCDMPYKYDSKKLEVGMRFGNIINVRYSTGKINWQSDDNRRADIKNQITIGIILAELHH